MPVRKLASLVCLGFLAVAALPAAAPDGRQKGPSPAAAVAKRLWAATEIVLEQAVDPPARQQLFLDGARALLMAGGKPATPGLAAKASRIATPEDLAAVLEEIWPGEVKGPAAGRITLEDACLLGMFGLTPEFSNGPRYLTPQQLKGHLQLTGNRYVGTGIQIRRDEKEELTQIVVPFPGGPARRAGARPGDLIVSVDGVDMKGKSLQEVVRRLQGEEGTPVTVVVRQPGAKEERTLKMIRGVIPFSSVMGFRRTGEETWSFHVDAEGKVGYLRIADINASTAHELRRLEPQVRAEGVQALVLDLRFTRGSDMTHAALFADSFLDGGVMWKVRDNKGHTREYKADRDCLFRDWPLAVLVGPQTGAMAEAVAAALEDNGRAVVVGAPTRGNLGVMTVVTLPDNQGGLVLRTGLRERAGQRTADHEPVDDETSAGAVLPKYRVDLDHSHLDRVLTWQRQQESPEPTPGLKAPDDPQLAKAIAVLVSKDEKKDKEKH
jgi:carboxyl-terminal processing protease